ncbi:MAG: NAD(P)/FAD-dependent oxidoreductase [Planctomycetota bacterium]|jgi:electron-transferring-flavoprotein dehydrogenase
MTNEYNKVPVLIVGAGPAGLSTAISLKKQKPELDVVVIDKAAGPGNHNLSGAVLEPKAIAKLMDSVNPEWAESDDAKGVLLSKVNKDDVMFLLGEKMAFPIEIAIKMAKAMGLAFGQMAHSGDYICSVSKLCTWLSKVAVAQGVELLYGFAAEEILWDADEHVATGVKLVDQGLTREGGKERAYLAGEVINADTVIIAEGCDGLLAEKFIEAADLERNAKQLYSIGVKELIAVSDEQYKAFGQGRVVHAMGYPIWTPAVGLGMFGGGIMYPMGDNHIAVGMIVGLDYKYCDFNPQDALTRFKAHKFVNQFIEGGTVTEAGAKMIPEGGIRAVPRCPETGTIGRSNRHHRPQQRHAARRQCGLCQHVQDQGPA